MTIEKQLTLMELEAFVVNSEYELDRFILPHFPKCIEKYESLDMNLNEGPSRIAIYNNGNHKELHKYSSP